ncbi:MAG: hypothetical protein IJP38_09635 [Oscillospiraceae bacterium]|nr:hypothetical protein [Oscillospiraceae bacterium]
MEDFNIEIIDSGAASATRPLPLPKNFVAVGDAGGDSAQIYIKQDVYKRIEKFAKEQMSKEVGSVLVGEYAVVGGRNTVIISDFIEAKYTDATAATLTFTHDTWDYINRELETNYQGKVIVGWQHTHPGYGVFLSSYDMFIQENFFNLPWQIAYVVDPIADTRGFFEWKDGKVVPSGGFFVYDAIGRRIDIDKPVSLQGKGFSKLSVILAILLALSLIAMIWLTVENGILRNYHHSIERIEQDLEERDLPIRTDDLI